MNSRDLIRALNNTIIDAQLTEEVRHERAVRLINAIVSMQSIHETVKDCPGIDPYIPNIDSPDPQTTLPPLDYACKNGRTNIVRALLEAKANPNGADSPIIGSSKYGYTDTVQALLEGKADPNKIKETGETALMIAIENNHAKTVKTLLDGKANPNLQAKSHMKEFTRSNHITPLLLAVYLNKIEIVQALLRANADPNLETKDAKMLPLLTAADFNYLDALKALLKAKADPNKVSEREEVLSALMFAVQKNHIQAIQILLEAKADPNKAIKSCEVALLLAIKQNHKEAIMTLLEDNANPNIEGITGMPAIPVATPLMVASFNADTSLIDELVKAKADPDLANSQGKVTNPLFIAIENYRLDVVLALLEAKADPRKMIKGNNLPPLLHAIRENGSIDIARLMLTSNKENINMIDAQGMTPLFHAALNPHRSWGMMELLVFSKANINHLDLSGQSVLDYVVIRKHTEQIKYLLDNGANITSFDKLFDLIKSYNQLDRHTYSLLTHLVNQLKQKNLPYAVEEAHLNKLKTLRAEIDNLRVMYSRYQFSKPSDIVHADQLDDTLLDLKRDVVFAAKHDIKTVEAALNRGAEVNVPDASGCTAFISAANSGNHGMMELLISRKANIDYLDNKGDSALDRARAENNLPKVRFLLDLGVFIFQREQFLDFLQPLNHRDANIYVCYSYLVNQLEEASLSGRNADMKTEAAIKTYFDNLTSLRNIHGKHCLKAVSEATTIQIRKKRLLRSTLITYSIFPEAICKLIVEYDHPLERLGDFLRRHNIDDMLKQAQQEEAKSQQNNNNIKGRK